MRAGRRFGNLCSTFSTSNGGNIKAYANEKGVAVLGDMPIYVAMDSADVWSGLPLFLIDEKTLKPEKSGRCAAGLL